MRGLFAVLLILSCAAAHCEDQVFVDPESIDFRFDPNFTQQIKSCNLSVTAIKMPQLLRITLTAASKGKDQIIWGFDLTSTLSQLSNGIPKNTKLDWIESGSLSSDVFKSEKSARMVPNNDGRPFFVSNAADAQFLAQTILRGDYFVDFSTRKSTRKMTYVIREAPPLDVMGKFVKCLDNL